MFNLAPILEAAKDKLIAIAVYDLETGAEYFLNADEAFHPASTIKVHVMMEVFHQAEQGLFLLEDCLPISNSFASIVDGSKFSLLQSDDGEQTLYPRIGEVESIAELTQGHRTMPGLIFHDIQGLSCWQMIESTFLKTTESVILNA
jgi:beta-lactamase class A